jgi:hypothetical protein
MSTFTPPSIAEVPPFGATDDRPLGRRLFRFYQSRQRGVAVFKMSDGTYQLAREVPGLSLTVSEPYPATTPDQFPQTIGGKMMIATSEDATTSTYQTYPAAQPQVAVVYYGGHSYPVSSTEAASLTAAGLGAYIT